MTGLVSKSVRLTFLSLLVIDARAWLCLNSPLFEMAFKGVMTMEKLELIAMIGGFVVLFGFLGFALLKFRKDKKDKTDFNEPNADQDLEPVTQVTQVSIDPVVVAGSTQEPKKVKEDFSSPEPISSVLKPMANTSFNLDGLEDEEDKHLERVRAEISSASLLAAKTGGNSCVSEGQWTEIVKKTFKTRTDLNQQRLQERERYLKGLVIINIMAPKGLSFYGGDVLDTLTNLGLRFGELGIFHKFDERGQKLFSISQAVNPGFFDINNMPLSSVKGLSCFFDLETVAYPKQAFRALLACVHEVSHYLKGEILDEHRQPLTQEVITDILKRIKSGEVKTKLEVKSGVKSGVKSEKAPKTELVE